MTSDWCLCTNTQEALKYYIHACTCMSTTVSRTLKNYKCIHWQTFAGVTEMWIYMQETKHNVKVLFHLHRYYLFTMSKFLWHSVLSKGQLTITSKVYLLRCNYKFCMTKCSQERQLGQRKTLPADICPYDFRLLFGCNIC